MEQLQMMLKIQIQSSQCNEIQFDSETTGSLWFYFKDEATYFNADIVNTNNFKLFKYKAKFLENAVADGANEMLKNATLAVLLKYITNFWISLEMSLINDKVKLKLKWTEYWVLSAGNKFLLSKTQNYMFLL